MSSEYTSIGAIFANESSRAKQVTQEHKENAEAESSNRLLVLVLENFKGHYDLAGSMPGLELMTLTAAITMLFQDLSGILGFTEIKAIEVKDGFLTSAGVVKKSEYTGDENTILTLDRIKEARLSQL